MSATLFIPYTYLIGWSHLDTWYYGVRFAQDCNPSDLWKTYFTSSKYVTEFREQYGEPDVVQIRKTFSSAEKAQAWETKVLNRLDVKNNERYLNKTPNKAIGSYPGDSNGMYQYDWGDNHPRGMKGKNHSLETRTKMSKAKKGKRVGDQNSMYGKTHTPETKLKMSEKKRGENNLMFGKTHTSEARAKISESRKGKVSWTKETHPETYQKVITQNKGKQRTSLSKYKMRQKYLLDSNLCIIDLKGWCDDNNHNYVAASVAANHGRFYKGMFIEKIQSD